jgi:hypothetical protein
MKTAKLALAVMIAASLVVPTVHAKSKKRAPTPASIAVQPNTPASPPANSQAGGLPATNERVTALEAAVVALRADLNAEIAARQAADAALRADLNAEIAARQAADAALASQIVASQTSVFVAEGSASNISSATAIVASRTVPAGNYFLLAAVQMVNGQQSGDANARCVMRADGNLLADTSDLEFPLLSTTGNGSSFGSTLHAPLHGSYSSDSEIDVVVECTESNGDNGGLNAFVQIAAVKVPSVQ